MKVKDQIKSILTRATQDFDGRDEIMGRALVRIQSLEDSLFSIRANFIRMGWEENSIMIESIDKVLSDD